MRKILLTLGVFVYLVGGASAEEPNPTFGVIESYEEADAAHELGIGWTRIRFPWAEVQPNSPNEWIPKVDEALISAELAAGREIVGLLIGIPQWARDSADLPSGLYLSHDDPDNLWANYMREAIMRYPEITHWVIWNEPDIWDENAVGYTWHGTEADFAQLMKVGYLTAKEINPEIKIHLSAMTFFWDNNFGRTQYLDRLLTELAKDSFATENNFYFDIATAHLYFQPNQVLTILDIWRGIMAQHGQADKPWWLTETNAPVSDDPTWLVDDPFFVVTQQDQANYIGQGIGVALSAGVERVAIFKLIDTESDRFANPEPFGLLRANGERRPGFAAYATLIGLLDSFERVERERWDGVGRIRVNHHNGTTHILFARGRQGATVEVVATRPIAQLIDALGNAMTIRPRDGVYTVNLPSSECNQPIGDGCMIGGTTYYLVQREPVLPTITPTAVPTSTRTPQPTATSTATPTSSPTRPMPTSSPTQPPQPIVPLQQSPTSEPTSNGRVLLLSFAALTAIALILIARRYV